MTDETITKEEQEETRAMTQYVMEQPITQDAELTGVLKNINEDILEKDTGLPSIDLKTRLSEFELSSIIIHDTIVSLGCLPKSCLITTRTKKRLAVSLQGKGREEIVQIVQSERERKTGTGMMEKFKGLFTPSTQ
jgi:hypothetical protein